MVKVNIEKYMMECLRCGHKWIPRQEEVFQCPKCKSAKWHIPKDDDDTSKNELKDD